MPDSEQSIIYVVDDEPAVPEFVGRMLLMDDRTYHVECFDSAQAVLERMAQKEPGVLVTDIWMPGTDGIALLKHVRDKFPEVEVILITAQPSIPTALQAFQQEAFAYLEKPFDSDAIRLTVRRALANRKMLRVARAMTEKPGGPGFDVSLGGAGSFFAAAWEYLPGEALVLDSSMRIVSANRSARARFALGRRIKPRVSDVVTLGKLVDLARQAAERDGSGEPTEMEVNGQTARASWAEFMDGVKFCVVWMGAPARDIRRQSSR